MFISKKKLACFSSILLAIIVFALFGTPCYRYSSSLVGGVYYLGYDFGFGGNIVIEAFNATLVSLIGVILAFNLLSIFIKNLDENKITIVNIVLWTLALIFAICCMFVKHINVNYNPTNSITFSLLSTIIGLVFSIFLLVYKHQED